LLVLATALVACGTDDTCELDTAPVAPKVMAPLEDRIDVVAEDLVIDLSPFSDPDADDLHGGTEIEIWYVDHGVPSDRVWSASLEGAVTQATIADGTFDFGTDLNDWTKYVVRARYRDDRGDCSTWSDWSTDLAFRTDDGSSYLFDPEVIREVRLTIPPESWDPINAEARPPGCVPFTRTYHRGSVSFEGETYEDVGLHIKGGCGSARDLGQKASFKVKIDWDDPLVEGCPDDRKLLGQKHLTLNNNVQDRTAEHERLGYELYQAFGVPTPRAATVKLYVNDTYWGVYTHVESVDRRFLSRWFESNDGMLYEGTYWCDLTPDHVPPTETDDSYCLTREFKDDACTGELDDGADPLTYTPLRDFVGRIAALPAGGFYPEIEEFFDFDTFLSQWAIESLMSHWDGYVFSIMNNYRVYHDVVTDRWSIIPTGIDQTFSGDQDPWGVSGTLGVKCLAEPDCEAAFAARLAVVSARFVSMEMSDRAAHIHDQIALDVMADPRKEYDNSAYADAYNGLIDFIGWRPGRLDEILRAHGF